MAEIIINNKLIPKNDKDRDKLIAMFSSKQKHSDKELVSIEKNMFKNLPFQVKD